MIDIEAVAGLPIPGPGPGGLIGQVITVPVPTTTVGQKLVTRNGYLMGWSFKETTGAGLVLAELFDGGDANGSFLAALDLDAAADPAVTQTPASAAASGAAAALAPTFGGAVGTTAFLQSLRITGLGATAAVQVTATLTGGLGGTINYPISVPAGVAVPITPVEDTFLGRGLQASASGVAFVLNVPSFGAGNTLAAAEIQGYLQGTSATAQSQWLGPDGIYFQVGLFLNVISGSARGAVWIRSRPV